MDGVIFDTERLYFDSEDELLRKRGRAFTPDLAYRMMGMPGLEAMELLRREHDLVEDAQSLFEEAQERYRAKIASELALMPGFAELLAAVEQTGLPRGVATSTRRELALHMLHRFDLPPRFGCILTRDDVAIGKPAPEIYLAACAQLRVEPSETLVLEDSLNGVRSALAAGCVTVGVRHTHNQLMDFSTAHFEVASLDELRLLCALDEARGFHVGRILNPSLSIVMYQEKTDC
jgi:HAD superfamily hydrolase (TIGR01509 family)